MKNQNNRSVEPKCMSFASPNGLYQSVLDRLEAERQAVCARRRFVYCTLFVFLLAFLLVPVWQDFKAEAARSGFADYAELGWQDFDGAMHSWQNFLLSLLETLPAANAVALLTTATLMLITFRLAARYARGSFRLRYKV